MDVLGLVTLLSAASACAVTLAVLVAAHEFGHAAAAWVLRVPVLAIDLGTGPAWFERWIGTTSVTVRRWPVHGFVVVAPLDRRWLRTRQVLIFAAGPMVNLAAFVILLWNLLHRPEWNPDNAPWRVWVECGCMMAGALLLTSSIPAYLSLGRFRVASDALAIWNVLRMSEADLEAHLQYCRLARDQHLVWESFLKGRLDEALTRIAPLCDATPSAWPAIAERAVLVMARDGPQAALTVQDQAEDAFAKWRIEVEERLAEARQANARVRRGPLAAQLASAVWVLAVNRAFFLVHTGRAEDLEQADALTASALAARRGEPAAIRTRGLVLLHSGRIRPGMALLREAWRGSEPIWLRALGAAYLAYGHALRGEARAADRWIRRAWRLHPSGLLLATRERLVRETLATATA